MKKHTYAFCGNPFDCNKCLGKKMEKQILPIPTEADECIAFADYLRAKRYLFSHIVNEAQTRNWGALNKAKAMGKNPGVPDFIIVGKSKCLIFVEMKRRKGGLVSEAQLKWVEELHAIPNVYAGICAGAGEAIKFLEEVDK